MANDKKDSGFSPRATGGRPIVMGRVMLALALVAAVELGFNGGIYFERARRPQLANGRYQTDNGPIVRVPGLPEGMELIAIFADCDDYKSSGVVRCLRFDWKK